MVPGKKKEQDGATGAQTTITSKVRAQLRERARREEIVEGLATDDPLVWGRAMQFHQSLVLAHDMVVSNDDDRDASNDDDKKKKKKKMKEGGPKMFCLASPWQALYRISRKRQNGGVAADVAKLKSVRSASSSLSSPAHDEVGRPLVDWPAPCDSRFDEMNEGDRGSTSSRSTSTARTRSRRSRRDRRRACGGARPGDRRVRGGTSGHAGDGGAEGSGRLPLLT